MNDPQSAWVRLGRRLFKACESLRTEGGCAAGVPTFHWLIKHSIVVQVGDSKARLWITRDKSSEGERFHLQCSRDETNPPENLTIMASGETMFRISGTEKDCTTDELCNELLRMLCGG